MPPPGDGRVTGTDRDRDVVVPHQQCQLRMKDAVASGPPGNVGAKTNIDGVIKALGSITNHSDPSPEVSRCPDRDFLQKGQVDSKAGQYDASTTHTRQIPLASYIVATQSGLEITTDLLARRYSTLRNAARYLLLDSDLIRHFLQRTHRGSARPLSRLSSTGPETF